MKMTPIAPILLSMLLCGFAGVTEAKVLFSGEKKQNNLVSELLEAASISKTGTPLTFTRSSDGWIFMQVSLLTHLLHWKAGKQTAEQKAERLLKAKLEKQGWKEQSLNHGFPKPSGRNSIGQAFSKGKHDEL